LITAKVRHILPSEGRDKGKVSLGELEEDGDFIRLPGHKERSTEEPLSTYRSIHTTGDDAGSDSDMSISASEEEVEPSESEEESTPRSAQQAALEALEAKLQKDPASIPTWMSLMEHTLKTTPPSSKASLARARAEIKISVLERAMRTDKRNKNSVQLRIMWLHAGSEIWEGDRLEYQWEQAVKELAIGNPDKQAAKFMWDEWLRWRISSAGRGTRGTANVEGVIADSVRVMENIEGELSKIKTLWRIALLLRDAGKGFCFSNCILSNGVVGFAERSMALFQAQVEL